LATRRLELTALAGLPLVRPGDDIAALILQACAEAGEALRDGDVLVIAQKIVSKAEDRYVDLSGVTPSRRAVELAAAVDKDPRQVELILSESTEVVKHRPGVLIVAHRLGYVMANAGIDASNVERGADGGERVLLLPRDPDGSCAALRAAFKERAGTDVAVIINDSFGRAWRNGTTGTALGAAGLPSLVDLRGEPDLFGRLLRVSMEALGDDLAAAASILQGQGNEGTPVVLVRGLQVAAPERDAKALIRPRDEDMFR
jgi:coenzyme F420-0:L-glutamate ligase/coenzyme F420-1:gamma-L-glutamate ligase